MNDRQLHALALRETDVKGALGRLCGNEAVYSQCLKQFLHDGTMQELNRAVQDGLWDDAFTAAHALKGVAGNMGFVPLMHSVGQLVAIIRGGRLSEIGESILQVNSCYRDITDAINQYFINDDSSEKGEIK